MGNSRLVTRPGRTATLTFPADATDLDEYNELVTAAAEATQAHRRAKLTPDFDPTMLARAAADEQRAKADLDRFVADMAKITIKVRSIGRHAYEKLAAKHPPTSAEIDRFNEQTAATGERGFLAFGESFRPALIAASIVSIQGPDDPEPIGDLTADELDEFFDADGWTADDFTTLFATCRALVQARTLLDPALVASLGND